MNRSLVTLIASVLALVGLITVALALPVPYVRMAPGPTFNVIGTIGEQPVIVIADVQTYPTEGALDMTTVSESGGPRGGLTFVQAIGAWFSRSDAVVPTSLLYQDDVTGEDLRRRSAALFSTSESNAVAAALNYLNLPIVREVVVTAVFDESPAADVFEPRDRILRLNGITMTEPAQVSDAIRAEPVGTSFQFEIIREVNGEFLEENIDVVSAANPDDPEVAYIGIGIGLYFAPQDFSVAVSVKDVGGPSAGLIFALGIIDKLTPEDLTGGKAIAGSGTVNPEGEVGAIGGLRQKLAGAKRDGAELFLHPVPNCREAVGFIPEGVTAVPVATLAEAAQIIADWRAGKSVPACPVSAPAGS